MSRRLEILRRATEVFERQGINQTSIEDIAQAVGIKREGIYYYFKNRSDILAEIILPVSASLLSNLRNIRRTSMNSRDKLRAAIRSQLGSFNPSYLEMTVALRDDHFLKTDDRLAELRQVWKDHSAEWALLIREGQESGDLRPDLDPKIVAFGILGMCNWVSRWFHPSKEITLDEIIETYSAMAVDGLLMDGATALALGDMSADLLASGGSQ